MAKKKTAKINSFGFSLLELSVVILIVSILVAGTLSVSTAAIRNARIKTTKNNINAIYEAMKIYVAVNYKLPCPAATNLSIEDSNFGVSVGADGTCSGTGVVTSTDTEANELVYGFAPVRSLGLDPSFGKDGFGNKISYIVNRKFTLADVGLTTEGFSLASSEDSATNDLIKIRANTISENPVITNNAIMALISHGENKLGGFSASSDAQITPLPDVTGSEGEKAEETNISKADFNEVFIAHSFHDPFDDIVLYKEKLAIIRDVGGNIAQDIPCTTNDSLYEVGGVDIYWNNLNSGQSSISTTTCPLNYKSLNPDNSNAPYRTCEGNGTWGAVQYPCVSHTNCTGIIPNTYGITEWQVNDGEDEDDVTLSTPLLASDQIFGACPSGNGDLYKPGDAVLVCDTGRIWRVLTPCVLACPEIKNSIATTATFCDGKTNTPNCGSIGATEEVFLDFPQGRINENVFGTYPLSTVYHITSNTCPTSGLSSLTSSSFHSGSCTEVYLKCCSTGWKSAINTSSDSC